MLRLPSALVLALAVTGTALAAQTPRVVTGRVVAADAVTPLARIVVQVVVPGGDSTVTDGAGGFRLTGLPRAPLTLAVRGPAILPDTVALAPDRDTITIVTRPRPITLPPVVVVERSAGIARERFETAQASATSLSPAEIDGVPGLLEADVLRAVQLLPGSVAKNDYTISYNVRGGEADQNLVRLDGIPLFNPSHLGGLFSTFDANAVGRTDFYTGGFPAWYPGRLSSVLDVELRPGNAREMVGRAQVSLLSSKALVEGPLGRVTYLVAARRTYADAVVGLLTDEVLPYYFTDAVGKVTVPLGATSLSVTGYWGRDALDLALVQEEDGEEGVRLAFNWGNALLGATWQVPVGAAGRLETRVGVSTFSTTLGLLPSLARFDNRARLWTGQATLIPTPDGIHDIRVGLGVEAYAMTYAAGSAALETSLFAARYRPAVLAAFIDDQWRPAGSLVLRPGIRLEYVTGAAATRFSPRLSARLFLDSRTALLGSAGRYHQAIHSIRDQELPVTVFEFWIGADRYIPVARSDHVVLGLERWLSDAVQLSVEAYRKTFANLVTPNRAQDLSVEGDEYVPAHGHAWGADLLLRKHAGTLRGWLAYGFTRTRREAGGVEFPPAHDRRHTLNVVALLPGPLGSDLGVRWGFGSPLPYTGFAGEWDHRRYDATNHLFDDVDREPIGGALNGERYPAYSRLDASLRWDVTWLGVRWEPYLQVANLYNRRNVFLYFFDYGDVPPTRTGVSQLPLVPTFGVELTF